MNKKLVIKTDKQDFESLLGIASIENDYKISWAINNQLSIKLKKAPDLEIKSKDKEINTGFSNYTYDNIDNHVHIKLLQNKREGFVLLKSYKTIDYFLMIESAGSLPPKEKLIDQLKSIRSVLAVFEIDLTKLSKSDIEMLHSV